MRTADGGHTWATTRVTPEYGHAGDPFSGNMCNGGDPSVAYSARDRVFFLTQLCFFRGAAPSEVHVFASRDNGRTWTPGRQAAIAATNFGPTLGGPNPSIFNDKEYITVDNTPTSPHYGRLYVTWTKFHMQPNGFSDYCPIQLAYTDTVPLFNPRLTTFQHTAVAPDNPGGIGLGVSADQDSQPVVQANGTLQVSFSEEECNTALDHHFHITTSMAFMYQNNINRTTSGSHISVQGSTNGGRTWSDARFVAVGPHGKPAANDQFFSWVTSDPAGTFYAIWLDNRDDPGNKLIETWEGVSHDNGMTWANSKLSTVAWNPNLGFFTSGAFIGDYMGVAAGPNVLYPVWVDGRNTAIASTGIGNTDIFTNVAP